MANRKPKRKKTQRRKQKLNRKSAPQIQPDGIDRPIEASIQAYRELNLDDTAALDIAMQMHPDIQQHYSYDGLPDEIHDETGTWSPRLHINMHAILERQLSMNAPAGIVDIAIAYEKKGVISTHQIRHAILDSYVSTLWESQRNQVPFDNQAYLDRIHDSYKEFCDALA